MCTVTYIPVKNGFLLSSNRDERQDRPRALEPHTYAGRTGRLLFPKDTGAGGTWFAAHEKGPVAVLLNGAAEKHISHPPYRRSRGLVLLEIIDHAHPLEAFYTMDLHNIEPFTVILVEEGRLHECRWDGTIRAHRQPDHASAHIWSSSTLYTPEVIRKREERFIAWRTAHPDPSMEDVVQFHRLTFLREAQMTTVSVTSLEYRSGASSVPDATTAPNDAPLKMRYLDLPTGKVFHQCFLTPAIPLSV